MTTTLRAAPATPVLTKDQTTYLLRMSAVESSSAEPFLDAVAAADFTVQARAWKSGRMHTCYAQASTTIETQEADHNRADLLRAFDWLFTQSVKAAAPGVRVNGIFDTRGKTCQISITVEQAGVPKAEVEATTAHVQALLVKHFGPALHEGLALTRRAMHAVRAAREAEHAVLTVARQVKEEAEAGMDYAARLERLKEEREKIVTANFAAQGFTDLSTDAMLLITPEVRQRAIEYVLKSTMFSGPFQITPVL